MYCILELVISNVNFLKTVKNNYLWILNVVEVAMCGWCTALFFIDIKNIFIWVGYKLFSFSSSFPFSSSSQTYHISFSSIVLFSGLAIINNHPTNFFHLSIDLFMNFSSLNGSLQIQGIVDFYERSGQFLFDCNYWSSKLLMLFKILIYFSSRWISFYKQPNTLTLFKVLNC